MNKVRFLFLAIVIMGIIPVFITASQYLPKPQTTASSQECNLRLTLNQLWTDHVMWTRLVIISALTRLNDVEIAKGRLLQNQVDLGNAITPFYGPQAGNQFALLLRQHILIAIDLVGALLTNNRTHVDNLNQQWHSNANDIASLLSQVNHYWDRKDLIGMFYQHLQLTAQEIQYRLQENWQSDAINFDQIVAQAQMMAQTFADGIIRQFSQRF